MHKLIIASPYDALKALSHIIGTDEFNEHFWVSIKRVSVGLSIGAVGGFVLGVIAGLFKKIRYLLEPLRWLLMSIPPVILVVLAMLWFGMGSVMTIFIISLVTAPTVYINTYKGIDMVDEEIIEMADIYKFSFTSKLIHIYIPSIVSPLSAALVTITGAGARMVVMAELLGANSGIGFVIGETRSNLEIPQLFAWVLTIITVVGLFEFGMLRPLHNHLMKWKDER